MRIPGEGEVGDNGASRGDLYILIKVKKHKLFKRQGNDLLCEIKISFPKAALGTKVKIPTFEGDEIIDIPSGTQPGNVLKLKGKGLQNINNHRKGDLYIKVNIETPKNLKKNQRDILKEFAKSTGEKLDSVESNVVSKIKNFFH